MDDFKSFMDKVIATTAGEADREDDAPPAQEENPAAVETLSPAQIEQRYVDAANAMHKDATAREAWHLLVDVLTWKLAVIAIGCGPEAAGDIVRRLGTHMKDLAERDRAQREAEQEKKEGRKPH